MRNRKRINKKKTSIRKVRRFLFPNKEANLILELIFQGLLQWIHGLILEIVEYAANGLLDVFGMDLAFFESALPLTHDILNIVIASGWALLLGNLVFQAAKSMMAGLGFEADDPRELFTRTFVFAFFLLASRQICSIGLGLSATLIDLLKVPDAVNITIIDENAFSIGASWLLVIIFTFVMLWQLIKLFLEVGERYFLVGLLTILAPWAFAMGGSKSTADIFKGWVRMFASMCLMMVLNIVILKLMLSAVSSLPSGSDSVPWMILIVAIARVGRKIDSVVMKIGLNPALTGDGLGKGLPGMLSYMVIRSAASKVLNTAGGAKSTTNNGGATHSSATRNAASASTKASSKASTSRASSTQNSSRGNSSSRTALSSFPPAAKSSPASSFVLSDADRFVGPASGTETVNAPHISSPTSPIQVKPNEVGSLGKRSGNDAERMPDRARAGVAKQSLSRRAGTPSGGASSRGAVPNAVSTTSGTAPQQKSGAPVQSRFTAVPPSAKPPRVNRAATVSPGKAGPGNAGTARTVNASSATSYDSNSSHATVNNSENTSVNRASSRPQGVAGTAQPNVQPPVNANSTQPTSLASPLQAKPNEVGSLGKRSGNDAERMPDRARAGVAEQSLSRRAGTAQNAPRPSSPAQQSNQRQRGNTAQPSATPTSRGANSTPRSATRENTPPTRETTHQTQKPTPGNAGTPLIVATNATKTPNTFKASQPNLNKPGATKNSAKNVTEKRKKSNYRSGGKDDSEQQ